jgi:poly(hydroxyalkanoate) granule-associated protein
MVKKLKQMADKKAAGGNGLLDSQLASSVKDSAQQIWLAGMGAFAKAQSEGGKVFESLVKEGASLQRRTQAVAEEKLGEVTGKMSAMADGVTSKAGQKWDKLESIFEERVSKALGKLGVPSSSDIDALIKRIDALSAKVSALSKDAKPAARAAARKPAAAKTSTRKPATTQPTAKAAKAAKVARPARRAAAAKPAV